LKFTPCIVATQDRVKLPLCHTVYPPIAVCRWGDGCMGGLGATSARPRLP